MPANPSVLMLAEEPKEQVDQILSQLGNISMEVSAFDAVYLVAGLQALLSDPRFCHPSVQVTRIENFAKKLGDNIYKHPALKRIVDDGWKAVGIARQGHLENMQAKIRELPTTKKELVTLVKSAGLPYSNKNKAKLIASLEALSDRDLVKAKEGALNGGVA